MSRRAKKTQSFGDAAERVLGRMDTVGKRHGARVVGVWSEVVGADIARHTQGFAFREGRELVVFVDTPTWANELSLMSADLMRRINSRIGEESVTSLRFTVSKRVATERVWSAAIEQSEAAYEPDQVEPSDLSDVEQDQAAHVAAVINDPELREIALRVMLKDLALKKGSREGAGSDGL
ncbi:MAG: DciA family protein [Coriobacteriia bacterium]